MTPSDIYLTIALDVIPKNDIEELLNDYGYDEEPSVALLYKAFEEKGDEFMHEFGELCLQNADSPLLVSRLRQAAGLLNKGTGAESSTAGLTEEQKQQRVTNGLAWFREGANLLIQVIGGAAAWTGQANGTASSQYEAEKAALELQMTKEETRQKLIIGGIVVVVVIVMGFMFFKMFGK